MSKKYGFLMVLSVIVEILLLVLSAVPFLNMFRPVGFVINDSFIDSLSKEVLFNSLGDSAFVLALIGVFAVGIYVVCCLSSSYAAPVKSAIAVVIFTIIAVAVLSVQVISFKSAPEPTVSRMKVVSTRIDSEFDINKFTNLLFGSDIEKQKARRNGVFTEVPKLCFENIDAEVSHDVYGQAKPGDEYYVVVIAGNGYAYSVSDYSAD